MKNYIFFIVLISFFFTSCDNNSEQFDLLTKENSELSDKYQRQLIKSKVVTREADSLQTIVHSLEGQIQKMKGEVHDYKASTPEEKSIEELVNNLHKGWASMLKQNNTNELLQYFLPKYTTSTVRIDTENVPNVTRANDTNFEDILNELMLAKNLALSFGRTKFLYTEVRGDIFVSSFRTRIRVYQDNEEVYTSSLVTQLAGENKDGWKVGNYNWVTVNYD